MHGYYKVAAAVPKIKISNTEYNKKEIIDLIKKSDKENVTTICFPELSITGYSCADLFFQECLLDSAESAIAEIAKETKSLNIISIIGVPLRNNNRLYNTAVVIQKGEILGVVPKTHLPNYKEYYEKRWFSASDTSSPFIDILEQKVPFGTNILFKFDRYFKFGIEICEDLWNVIPPSSYHCLAGATLIFNPSASNELVSKSDYRKSLISGQSGRGICGYIYASAGVYESTTDVVYSGHAVMAENGAIIAENERFQRNSHFITTEIDCKKLYSLRISESSYEHNKIGKYETIQLSKLNKISQISRTVSQTPFVPSDYDDRNNRCEEILNIQIAGLAKRIEHINLEKVVIGISGGLDSTLALLVIVKTFKLLNKPLSDIITITMPGFGTTDRTYHNAVDLCKLLETDIREINIKDACLQHFKDIDHNPEIHDVTYENVQARERTKILMNIANKSKGIVIGTGDLSEIALGWSTYNGDHMSMYAVNCSVPKTLIRYLIQWVAENAEEKLKKILIDVIDTPVSPELLPNRAQNEINQKTEDILGPYELHDFFLYHSIKYGATKDKILFLANYAFKGKYNKDEIENCFNLFHRRFYTQQFKRSCIPDGPKVGTISLSPRGDWRMPSDASF